MPKKVGNGGIAIFWESSHYSCVILINLDGDFITGLQYQISKYMIQGYLPSATHRITQLDEYML